VLPHDYDGPTGVRKKRLIATITLNRTLELRKPVIEVGLGQHGVDRATVPEAAATLNGDASPRENHIRTTT
jgi:hypothetical protein